MNANEGGIPQPSGDRPEVDTTDESRLDEDEALRESLAGLARLATSRLSLESLLTEVATYAVRASPEPTAPGSP